MIQAFARRLRQLFGRPELPLGDVAGESWNDVGALPPASLMPVEEPGLILLDLRAPPPVPMDARPPRTDEEREWEATLARMLARPDAMPIAVLDKTAARPDPTPAAPFVTRPAPSAAPEVTSSDPTPTVEPVERDQDDDWDTLILAAKARTATAPARRAATLVRTPPPVRLSAVIRDPGSEDRAWEEMISRAKRRAEVAPPLPAAAPRRRPRNTGETGDWSAVIAAAKLRHQLQDRA